MNKAEELYHKIIEDYDERNYMAEEDGIKLLQLYADEKSREKKEVLNKIGELLEKDIPESKFILALLQIKKWVQPYYSESTGI